MYKSPRCFLPSFKSIGLSVEKKRKIDFQEGGHGDHLGFPIGTILAVFVLQAKNRFSRWPLWISSRKDLSHFDLQVSPMLPTSFKSIGFSVQEKKQKIDFQDGRHGGNLGFPIGMILAIFDLQVTPMLPTELQVNWPFGSGEEAKNRFSRPWWPSWISDWNNFSYFLSKSHPDASYQDSSQLAFWFRKRSEK